MPIIYSNVSNEKYTVCCMGQTVYIYSKAGSELARFTLVMADFPVISPKDDVFAVKSKDGCLALYSFEKLVRTATLKFSDKETPYEKGMCFSENGDILYNIEYADAGTYLCCYNVEKHSVEKKIILNAEISHIECDSDSIFVLGKQNEKCIVSKVIDDGLCDIGIISDDDYDFYYKYKCAEARGFSSAAMDAFLPNYHNIEDNKTSLCDLWKKYEVKTDE